MDILLLGGASPRNKEWIHQVGGTLAPLFGKTVMHDYAHWAFAGPDINLDHELNLVKNKARELGDYIIFAKSAGAVLSIKGIAKKELRPRACLFTGLPLGFINQHGHQVDEWLKHLTMPVIFVQNSHDPTGSYKEVEQYLRQHLHSPHYRLIETPGDTHSYDDLDKIKELAAELSTS